MASLDPRVINIYVINVSETSRGFRNIKLNSGGSLVELWWSVAGLSAFYGGYVLPKQINTHARRNKYIHLVMIAHYLYSNNLIITILKHIFFSKM